MSRSDAPITKYPIQRFVGDIKGTSSIPKKISAGIVDTVLDFSKRFHDLDDRRASHKPNRQKWSAKEIIGHLIDSASNNHQRFVRVQYLKDTNFPSYEQKEWVNLQRYNERPWSELLSLWKSYNLHLAHVLSRVRPEYLTATCTIGSNDPVTFGYVAMDYLGHMQHHIKQLENL